VVAEPGKRIVDVSRGSHDTQVTESVYRGVAMIGDHRGCDESRQLEPAVTILEGKALTRMAPEQFSHLATAGI
jgi:hypothetical protein